jgi:orotidine-5'-phosphate decarboxylase
MELNFADQLMDAIREKGSPVCVGIDPDYEKLPKELAVTGVDEIDQLEPIGRFCKEVLQIVSPIVPAVKVQSAYFERYGWQGVRLYGEIISMANDLDLITIGDVKRNDIGSTAKAYALGHLSGVQTTFGPTLDAPDAITVNGYFGADGLQPFIDQAAHTGRGVFVLVRTSNPSAAVIQDITDSAGAKVYEHVARMVAGLGSQADMLGASGYSCVGAVVGATWPKEAQQLRAIMPQQIFLVPGYGAQGATATDCAAAFKPDGTGAIVNASRSVIFAYNDKKFAEMDWKSAIEQAAKEFAKDIAQAVGKKN